MFCVFCRISTPNDGVMKVFKGAEGQGGKEGVRQGRSQGDQGAKKRKMIRKKEQGSEGAKTGTGGVKTVHVGVKIGIGAPKQALGKTGTGGAKTCIGARK